MPASDIHLPNQSGKVDPRLTVSRPFAPKRKPKEEPKVGAARRISSTLRALVGRR